MNRTESREGRGGFALVAALWLLVALAAVALHASLESQERRRATANALDRVRARAAAEAGAEYARSRLTAAMVGKGEELRAEALARARSARTRRQAMNRSLSRLFRSADPLDDPWREPQQLLVSEMTFGDARYTVYARDLGSTININAVRENVIRQFFAQGLRVDFADADRITQAILDWRDGDDIPRVNGGERDEYLAAGRAVLPSNRDFDDVDELRHVLGMTPELFVKARPFLTTVGSDDININSAPKEVLAAVPGLTEAAAAEIVRRRESGVFPSGESELRRLVPSVAEAIRTAGRTFDRATNFDTNEVEIVVEGTVDGGTVRVREQLVVTRTNTEAGVVWRKVR